jgi:hypothetical protein
MFATFALDLLAENNFGDTRTGSMAGPMGLLIILLLCIATVLLIRNMNARIRRLPITSKTRASLRARTTRIPTALAPIKGKRAPFRDQTRPRLPLIGGRNKSLIGPRKIRLPLLRHSLVL